MDHPSDFSPADWSLTEKIIGAAMRVHRELGAGFLELVYRNALTVECRDTGLSVETEKHLVVSYRGTPVGHYVADLIVNGAVIVELKAASALSRADHQQLVNYLKATGLDTGLLLNFGTDRLEFKRKQRILTVPDLQPPPVHPVHPVHPV
jgi:GxxExxY protein